ncbi:type IV pilus assembly protein PilO [Pseudomonas sp. ok272]|uniref:type 4a pilus biogenesis protein PilO n=1 Tax=unclassified Pseudomonas TaxID=196821 RepID=UPI0008B06C48|nr:MULTISPECIES: type 4a pilus biogenesis protein PilO [unclassified Pseudomonas]SEN34390.1 type IV pilus assembly protein PilO [Pseudomonas sp. ok272]SFM84372.1 type IV pilus assembly protein PilO [Pseudomonas sp. ok602]
MTARQRFERLAAVELAGFELRALGAWPASLKILAGVLWMAGLLALGYHGYLKDLDRQLERVRGDESALKQQFARKASSSAGLERHAEQVAALQATLAQGLQQLPGGSQVPGWVDDISRLGLESGLAFEEIKLLPEVSRVFYLELPIQITVTGTYQALATFVGGLARLPRLVTLHDFSLAPQNPGDGTTLRLSIQSRTYRYNDQGGPS